METLFRKHRMFISQVNMDLVRDVMHTVAWEKQLVGIKGSRGVGKTTLMRQYIKSEYGDVAGYALYCVTDSMYFTSHSLLDLAEQFHLMGGRHLFLDEVHKYPTWSREIKEIIDLYPDLKVTFTGSSLIQILNADADLSRRVLSYDMHGLSFREYLKFYHKIDVPSWSLEEVLDNPDEICERIVAACGNVKPLFDRYLKEGYYPFYDGEPQEYYSRLENVVSFIIDQELTRFCGVEMSNTRKLKALMMFLANNVPYEVNIAKLSAYLELNKSTVHSYLISLQRAELLHLLYSDNKSVTKMQKPDKIYLNNPNLLFALGSGSNVGTVRECFVVNQLRASSHGVEYGKSQGDFLVDEKYKIEIGGKDKSFMQIADLPLSYIFADDMEFPVGKKLPLWLLGLLY